MKKEYKHIFIVISVLLYFCQILMELFSSLPQSDFKLLVLAQTPEFAYQNVTEFPVWISSLFVHAEIISPVLILRILKLVLLVLIILLLIKTIYQSTSNLLLAIVSALMLQVLLMFNQTGLSFLLLLVFLIPSVYFFLKTACSVEINLPEKRNLILSAFLFGFTLLIHPVSFLLFVFLFGSLLVSKKFLRIPETYLCFLILFIFISPKMLWEIQNQSKVQCSRFIYTDTVHETINSGFVIVDDHFQNWEQLYQSSISKGLNFSLLSSFENRNVFLWRHGNETDSLYFTFSNPNQAFGFTPVSSGFRAEERILNSDEDLFFKINQNFQQPWLYWISYFFFWLGQWGVFISIPVLLLLTRSDWKSVGMDLGKYLILIIIAALIITAIKTAIMRPRPLKEFGEWVWVWFTPVKERSFPSGDAQAVFTMLIPLWWLRPKLRWLILLAPFTALNRVVAGAHFPFDILTGSIIGISTAWTAKLWLWEKSKE